MLTWNWLDCILAAIVLASVASAVVKGFVRELIALGSVVLGLGLAAFGYGRAAAWFEDIAKSHEVALGLGFLAIFLATLLLGVLVSYVVRKLVQTVGLQWFDRLLGGVFGLLRGILVDAVILMVLVAFAIKPDAVRESALAPYITTGARGIALVMPASLRTQFHRGFERFHEELMQTDKGLKK
jgi:membrane protein required for colicin V production